MPDDRDRNRLNDDFDEKTYLIRIDERTKNIEEEVEDNTEKINEVEKRAQKNRNMIAKFSVVIGAVASAAGAAVGVFATRVGELLP